MKTNIPLQIERHFMPSTPHQTEAITALLALPKSPDMPIVERYFATALDPHCGSHEFMIPLLPRIFQAKSMTSKSS